MANSINNWLGFSLSSNKHYSQNSVSELGFNSNHHHQQAVSDDHECFNLTSADSTNIIPSLNNQLPPHSSFPIFEAFTTNPQSQDWNVKDVSMNPFSCSSTQQNQEIETPKLENFLGVETTHSFTADNNNSNQQHNNTEGLIMSNNMGFSMIKNWLRNHPVSPDNEAAPPVGGPAQTLSLSMSTAGSQSSDNKLQTTAAVDDTQNNGGAVESHVPRKSIDTFGQRTSIYRGVTRHRWTGRYEAHLWDNSCRREGQTRKGRQVYLGGYDKEDKAARSYDLAALKYWGTTTTTNFPISNYEKELEEMKHMTRQEFVASLRRKSSGFSRGASIYRGVTRHHQHGRWQARIGRVAGNKDLYLGTFSTQEEAAEAYDIAAIKFRGLNAVTNFEISRYDVKSILESSTLPIGGGTKRLKDAENAEMALQMQRADEGSLNLQLTDHDHTNGGWPTIAFQAQPLSIYPYVNQRMWCKQEQDSDVVHHHHHHQLQLGNNQSFLQQPACVMHNLMSLDSSNSVERSSGFVYGSEANESSFVLPMMGSDEEKVFGYHEGMFGSADAYDQQARNLYYQSSSNSNGIMKGSLYNEEGNNWIPSGLPALAARANTFTVWNDT